MAVQNLGLQAVFEVWAAEPAGVGELEPDQQIVVALEALPVRANQFFPDAGEFLLSFGPDPQLVGVGAAFMAHGDGLSAPYQLGAALSEVHPAPLCDRAGPSIGL